MEKVTETKIYERFRVGGQIPVCGPVFLRPLVTPRMPLLTPLQLCMAFPLPLTAVTAVHLE